MSEVRQRSLQLPVIGSWSRHKFQSLEVGVLALSLAAGLASARPVLPAFELFATNRTEAGLLLLAELNCTACHEAPEAWQERLAPVASRSLVGVGTRLDSATLKNFVAAPSVHAPGTKMPALFDPKNDDAKLDALAAYLGSLRETVPVAPAGDATRGRELFHRIGCVACHEPEKAGPDAATIVRTSVPLALARTYPADALADFLRQPLRHRPGGRMPDFHLNEQEAADLATYLRGEKPAATLDRPAAPALVEKGKQHFVETGCSACHDVGEKPPPPVAKSLSQLGAAGCLASEPKAGVPHFALDEAQRDALLAALRTVQAGGPEADARKEAIWSMARLNCFACHQRDGLGGPEAGRAPFFTVNDATTEALGEMAKIPPKLDRAGRKLTAAWFERMLTGTNGSVRPYMNTRMPAFGKEPARPVIAALERADKLDTPVEIDVSGTKAHHRAELGRKLLGVGGLACVSCHGLGDRKALGPPVIRLTHTAERLRPEYFKELLLNPQVTQPGTVMPPLLAGRKTADKDIESIWTYLREFGAHPMPVGLAGEGDYELKPVERPIVLRSFIEGAGTHAIGVGFPGGLNAAFDAKNCRWAIIWKGRFLDAFSNFQDRPMKPIAPLGTEVKALPAETAARAFRGYRLEKDGTPVMLYMEDGKPVEDVLRPAAGGSGFERTIRVGDELRKERVGW